VAVFTHAAGADFDFDSLLHQALDAHHGGDDLEDYEIAPISLTNDHPEATSQPSLPNPPPAIPTVLADPPPMGLTIHATSHRAGPKSGTAELEYRKAKGKAREKLKAQQRKEAAPYGDFAVNPRLINKHIKKAGCPIRTSLDASNMPHASTSYVGMRYSGGPRKVFGLDELIGKDSIYGFELRKWDGQ